MTTSLPPFQADGTLPPGDYDMTLDELQQSVLVHGPTSWPHPWDTEWRATLVASLQVLVPHLWSAGAQDIYIDGSFATDKSRPGDVDGYFVCDRYEWLSGRFQSRLMQCDPLWTSSKAAWRKEPASGKPHSPLWFRYHAEFFPHYPGLSSGVPDPFGNEYEFPRLFRTRKDRPLKAKGIIHLLR